MEQTFWHDLPRPIIGLAPMDGISDHPFRHIQKKYGSPALVYTEFSNVENICLGDLRLLRNFLYDESQRPIVAQIYGHTPDAFYQVAILLCELGFDGIDINMGCPARSIAHAGAGAGLIRTPPLAQQIVRAAQRGVMDWRNGAKVADCADISPAIAATAAVRRQRLPAAYRQRRPIPVSVKTRIGYDRPVVHDWIPTLLETEPAAIGVHGRTLKQRYKGSADWDAIGRAAELTRPTPTLFLGNGDVGSHAEARQKARDYRVDGVLIGRASYGNPFIFCPPGNLDEDCDEHPAPTDRAHTFARIALEHSLLYAKTFSGEARYHFLPMRKHLGWYARGMESAVGLHQALRTRLLQTHSAEEVEQVLQPMTHPARPGHG